MAILRAHRAGADSARRRFLGTGIAAAAGTVTVAVTARGAGMPAFACARAPTRLAAIAPVLDWLRGAGSISSEAIAPVVGTHLHWRPHGGRSTGDALARFLTGPRPASVTRIRAAGDCLTFDLAGGEWLNVRLRLDTPTAA